MNYLAYLLHNLLNSSPLFSKLENWSNEAAAGLSKIIYLYAFPIYISFKILITEFFKFFVIE